MIVADFRLTYRILVDLLSKPIGYLVIIAVNNIYDNPKSGYIVTTNLSIPIPISGYVIKLIYQIDRHTLTELSSLNSFNIALTVLNEQRQRTPR